MQNESSLFEALKLRGFPWRPLAALVLALTAQLMLEPPAREWISIALYIAAICFVVWSFLRGEWALARMAEDMYHGDTETLRFKSFVSVASWFRGSKQILFFLSLLLLGAAFYFFSSAMIPLWLWTLTPLTSAAIGAWCIGIGVTTAWGIWENDARRLRGAMLTYALFGILQLLAVSRYASQVNWNNTLAFFYLAFLVSALVMGALGVMYSRRAD